MKLRLLLCIPLLTPTLLAQGPLDPPPGPPSPEMKSAQELWARLQDVSAKNAELQDQLDILTTAYAIALDRTKATEEAVLDLRAFAEGIATPPGLYPGLVFSPGVTDSGPVTATSVNYPSLLDPSRPSITDPAEVFYSGFQNSLASSGSLTGCAYTTGSFDPGYGSNSELNAEVLKSDLMFAKLDDQGLVVGLHAVSTPSQVGSALLSDPSLAITLSENPIIAYRYDDGLQMGAASELHVAVADPTLSTWTIQVIDSGGLNDVGHNPSLAIRNTAGEEPAVAYEDLSNDQILYSQATLPGAPFTWSSPQVVATSARAPSLATHGSTIAVSYYDTSTGSLRYATRSGASWGHESVDSASGVGSESSLAFTAAGNPVIAYRDELFNRLKVAEWNGSIWQISVVTDAVYSAVAGGASPQLVVLPSGSLGVSCLANVGFYGDGEILYLERTGTTWDRFNIQFPGRSPGVTVNQLGRPVVSSYRHFVSSVNYVILDDFGFLGSTGYTSIRYEPGALFISTPK